MKTRIYIDTSIVGGFFDKEFEKDTKALFQRLENKEIVFVISSVLLDAPEKVRDLLNNYPQDCFENVEATEETDVLARKYIEANVVGETSFDDCRHIAITTINKVDVLASWNFKHIVNLSRINGYNRINKENGYSKVEIRSPKELKIYG